MDIDLAFSNVYRLVTRMSRRCPRSHRGDAHKLEFLQNAVVGYSWSLEPFSRVATHSLTFQQLYSELEAALQLEKESKLGKARDEASISKLFGYADTGTVRFTTMAKDGMVFIPLTLDVVVQRSPYGSLVTPRNISVTL